MKRFLLPILVLLSSLSAFRQYANVSATLTDGTGSIALSAYLHFSLRNCGGPQEGWSARSVALIVTLFACQSLPVFWAC